MAEDNRAQEAPEGSITVEPKFIIAALQQEVNEATSTKIMTNALVQQLMAQVEQLSQELQQTRLERDALVEARPDAEVIDLPSEKAPAKS